MATKYNASYLICILFKHVIYLYPYKIWLWKANKQDSGNLIILYWHIFRDEWLDLFMVYWQQTFSWNFSQTFNTFRFCCYVSVFSFCLFASQDFKCLSAKKGKKFAFFKVSGWNKVCTMCVDILTAYALLGIFEALLLLTMKTFSTLILMLLHHHEKWWY